MKKIKLNIQLFAESPYINFENLPSTTTPVNATNLNNMQLQIKQAIDDKQSLPTGGTTGQVLSKNSNGDYDVGWSTPSSSDVVVDDISGTATNKSPSQRAVHETIGDLSQLNTTDKSSLVNSINENTTLLKPTILFEDTGGKKGSFSLNDNWENYKIIEVFYKRGEYQVDSSRAYTDLTLSSILQIGLVNCFYGYGSGFWTSWKNLKFSPGSKTVTIAAQGNGYVRGNGQNFTTSAEEQILVLRVIGWK